MNKAKGRVKGILIRNGSNYFLVYPPKNEIRSYNIKCTIPNINKNQSPRGIYTNKRVRNSTTKRMYLKTCKDEKTPKERKDALCSGLCYLGEVRILAKDQLKEDLLTKQQMKCIKETCDNKSISDKKKAASCPWLCPIKIDKTCDFHTGRHFEETVEVCLGSALEHGCLSIEEYRKEKAEITNERNRLKQLIRDERIDNYLGPPPWRMPE